MKKFFVLTLCVVVLLCAVGCSSWEEDFEVKYLGDKVWEITNKTSRTLEVSAVEFKYESMFGDGKYIEEPNAWYKDVKPGETLTIDITKKEMEEASISKYGLEIDLTNIKYKEK